MKRTTSTAALAAILTVGAHAQTVTLDTLTESVMVGSTDTDSTIAPAAPGDGWYTSAYAGMIRGRATDNFERRTQWNFRFDITALAGLDSADIEAVTLSIPQIGRLNAVSYTTAAPKLYANTYDWDDDGSVDYPTWNRGRPDVGGDGYDLVAGVGSIGTYDTFGLVKDIANTNVEGNFIITSTTGNPADGSDTLTTEGVTALLTAVQSWAANPADNEGLLLVYASANNTGLAFGTPTLVVTLAQDTDGDGMTDAYEIANGTNINVDDTLLHQDDDGLNNIQEYLGQDSTGASTGYGQTLSGTADTDGDGLNDKEEVEGLLNPWSGESTDPLNQHSDGDGITDFEELDNTNGSVSDPNSEDSDGDLMTDDYELANGTDLVVDDASGDKDNDLLTNVQEFLGQDSTGTDTTYGQTLSGDEDSDGDKLNDREEVEGLLNPWKGGSNTGAPGDFTNPNDTDSDDDGLNDFVEIDSGNGSVTDPNYFDSDVDNLPDGWEVDNSLNPLDNTGDDGELGDPDGDRLLNIDEFNGGTDPQVPAAGLVDHWALDEEAAATEATNSTTADINRQGTVTGGVTTGVAGILGKAYQFDGIDGHVEMDQDGGYKGVILRAPRTISVWVKTSHGAADTGTGTNGAGIFGWGDNANGQRWEMAYNIQGGTRIPHAARANFSGGTRTGSTVINDDTWRLITLSHLAGGTAGDTALRINGIEELYSNDASPTRIINTPPTFNVKLGAGNDGRLLEWGYYSGLLDDAAIWDVTLTEDEVTSLYDVGVQLGYDAADFDALRDLELAGSGSVMIDGATWTSATGLTDPAGLSRSGTNGTLVLDATAQTGFTGVDLPEATVEDPVITAIRHGATVEVDASGLSTSTMYQMVRSATLLDEFPEVVDGPLTPAGTTDTFSDTSMPLPAKAFYRIEQMP